MFSAETSRPACLFLPSRVDSHHHTRSGLYSRNLLIMKEQFQHPLLTRDDRRVSKNGLRIEKDIVGTDHTLFAMSGGVDITHVLQLLDLARRIAVGHPDFIRGHFIKPYLSFFLLTDVYLTPELRKDAPSKWINWKLTLAVEMVNFNRNSSIMRVDILDKESAVPLVTCLTKAMYVNAKTRRRDLDLPQWVQSSTSECLPVKMTYDVPPSIPGHAHASSYTVRHSDMDYNNHTNHVIYTRVCIDAASIACKNGSFRVFKNHMYDYDIVDCSSFFKSESKFGDELVVHVWQDDVRDDILHFVIRNNNQDIYLCKTTFLIPITSKY